MAQYSLVYFSHFMCEDWALYQEEYETLADAVWAYFRHVDLSGWDVPPPYCASIQYNDAMVMNNDQLDSCFDMYEDARKLQGSKVTSESYAQEVARDYAVKNNE